MRKSLFFLITAVLCLATLLGCSQDVADVSIVTETDTVSAADSVFDFDAEEKFCRVVSLKEDGIVVEIGYIGYVYVKHIRSDMNIKELNTVVIKFSGDDLIAANGTFINFDGKEMSYSYILEEPESIRFTITGEPTFG